mgnify:CR=1 FL=1
MVVSGAVGGGGGGNRGGQRTQPVTRAEPRCCGRACAAGRPVDCSSAAATARTSHVLTETPSRAAAVSACVLRWSGRRRVVRVVAPASTSAGAGPAGAAGVLAGTSASGGAGGVSYTQLTLPPRAEG